MSDQTMTLRGAGRGPSYTARVAWRLFRALTAGALIACLPFDWSAWQRIAYVVGVLFLLTAPSGHPKDDR